MSSSKTPWKKRREIPDPQVRDAAEQYDDARQLLQQQPPGTGVLLPLLNTAAVAVELFLKSLSSKLVHVPVDSFEGLSTVHAVPEQKHHRLVELFDSIQDDVRRQLESSFASYTTGQAGTSLRDLLLQYEGLFAVSRYPFEPATNIRKYPLMPLMELSTFFRKFVADLEPIDQIEWS
jgi:hypothetical protein